MTYFNNSLEPYGQYSNTSPPLTQMDLSHQAGFSDTPQLYLDNHEKVDDVSTWNLQTLKEVATSISQKVTEDPALFDVEDQWPPASQAMMDPYSAWNDENDNDDYEEEDVLDVYGGMCNNPAPLYAGVGNSVAHLPLEDVDRRNRKPKMYELPKQSDPVKEKKRLRALRQFQQRQKEKEMEQSLRRELQERQSEIANLTAEAQQRQRNVQMLKKLLAKQKLTAQQGYMGGQQGGF